MLVVAFSFLPPSLQTHVADSLRAEVLPHADLAASDPALGWMEVLQAVNPVLSWSPASNCLELGYEGWQRLMHYAAPQLRNLVPSSGG